MLKFKHFPILSVEQVSALTDDEITKVIDLECAKAGVPLFLECPAPPVMKNEPDCSLFGVGGYYFLDRAHAEKVLELVKSLPRVREENDWRSSHSTYKEDDYDVTVHIKKVFTPEKHMRLKAELATFDQQKHDYDAALNKFKAADEKRSIIASSVWSEINDARGQIRERQRLLSLYEKYVHLANGDREIAWNFLKSAEQLTVDDVQCMKLSDAIPEAAPEVEAVMA